MKIIIIQIWFMFRDATIIPFYTTIILQSTNGYTMWYGSFSACFDFVLVEILTPLLSTSSCSPHSSPKPIPAMATDIDTYPMETLSSMVVVKRRDNEVDYQHDSKSNRDEAELAHFGKRQQLKVGLARRPLRRRVSNRRGPGPMLIYISFISLENFRSRLHDRTDLHVNGDLGRNINVSCPSLYHMNFSKLEPSNSRAD